MPEELRDACHRLKPRRKNALGLFPDIVNMIGGIGEASQIKNAGKDIGLLHAHALRHDILGNAHTVPGVNLDVRECGQRFAIHKDAIAIEDKRSARHQRLHRPRQTASLRRLGSIITICIYNMQMFMTAFRLRPVMLKNAGELFRRALGPYMLSS